MLTSKQRAYLRSLANTMQPIFNIGKEGVEQPFVEALEAALEKRELVKLHVLNNSGLTAKEAMEIVCDEMNCEPVQVIGSKIVIYRESTKDPKIQLPR